MKNGYYIFNPSSNIKQKVSYKELTEITRLTSIDLLRAIESRKYFINLGFILPLSTTKADFDSLARNFFPNEVWRDIPIENCNYQISNYGRVRFKSKKPETSAFLTHKIIPSTKRHYVHVQINKRTSRLYIDILIAMCFLSGYSEYKEIEYIDGNRNNLYYKNLKLVDLTIKQKLVSEFKKAKISKLYNDSLYPDERWVHLNREGSCYEISDYGRIRREHNGKYTYLQPSARGNSKIPSIMLNLNGKKSSFVLSRLVAEHFLDDFSPELRIRFKDGNNNNLYYKNLEYISKHKLAKETAILARKLPKVICIEKETGKTSGPYDSARHASRELGINRQSISDNLNGKSKLVAKKYIFRYLEEDKNSDELDFLF